MPLLLPRAQTVCLCAAMAANIYVVASSSPVLQDHHHWSMQTDATVIAMVLLAHYGHHTAAAAEQRIAAVVRWQMVAFYSASGIWKLTSSFLDTRFSCGSILLVQIACGQSRGAPAAPTAGKRRSVLRSAERRACSAPSSGTCCHAKAVRLRLPPMPAQQSPRAAVVMSSPGADTARTRPPLQAGSPPPCCRPR